MALKILFFSVFVRCCAFQDHAEARMKVLDVDCCMAQLVWLDHTLDIQELILVGVRSDVNRESVLMTLSKVNSSLHSLIAVQDMSHVDLQGIGSIAEDVDFVLFVDKGDSRVGFTKSFDSTRLCRILALEPRSSCNWECGFIEKIAGSIRIDKQTLASIVCSVEIML
jgi:hypothetical protein